MWSFFKTLPIFNTVKLIKSKEKKSRLYLVLDYRHKLSGLGPDFTKLIGVRPVHCSPLPPKWPFTWSKSAEVHTDTVTGYVGDRTWKQKHLLILKMLTSIFIYFLHGALCVFIHSISLSLWLCADIDWKQVCA